ncbi:PQQ-binding-like beta-propeller repeat protein [Flexivirga caeni]|uniref:Pyrrolo-quinoline quinone repeat domain-containing protein n=1 Tax=Flexivirga caeni TaxID=2294115 RepID=A0A3M9M6B7_9MICO|nr:PQQ-binding-like beta-propeller repeat protein [Flexivirga caeni]RNI21101.1 hypothetical protein EFY87_12545 [Flexivirga caeni]
MTSDAPLVEQRWASSVGQRPRASAVAVSAEVVVAQERQTRLVCRDVRDGTVRWERPAGVTSFIEIAGGRCLATSGRTVTCRELGSGELLWRVENRRPVKGFGVVSDVAVMGGWRGYSPVEAVDLATGQRLWSRRIESATAVDWAGAVLLGGRWEVQLLNRRDGAQIAQWQPPEPLAETHGDAVCSVVDDEFAVVRAGGSSVWCLGRSRPGVVPVATHWAELADEAPIVTGDLVWVREKHGGAVIFTHGVRGGRRLRPMLRRRATGRIVSGATRHATGTLGAYVGTGSPVVPGVVRAPGGRFLVATEDGALVSVDPAQGLVGRQTSVGFRPSELRALPDGGALLVTKNSLLVLDPVMP